MNWSIGMILRGSIIFFAGLVGCVHAGVSAEIWLAGVDPYVRGAMHLGSEGDYLELFDDGAPWTRAALGVKVFKTSTQYLLNAQDDALRRMIAGLRRRGIALALEGLMLPPSRGCGQGIEGYSEPGTIQAAAERIRELGGTIYAVAMDEPLWFGHHYDGAHACKASIDDVARSVAANVAALRSVFPAARVGDIEPLDAALPVAWADEILQFTDAFAAATGRPLDFVHVDVDWKQNWRPALDVLAGRVHASKIAFGIIYNGDLEDDSDQTWTGHATERFEMVEAIPQLAPDQAILQTWMPHPDRMLPETRPGTMTNLVLSYLRPATRLDLEVYDDHVAGRLTDVGGHPLAAAQVTVSASDGLSLPRLTLRRISGQVPTRAARALVGVRLNTECTCLGAATVWIGIATYREQDAFAVEVTVKPPGENSSQSERSSSRPASFHVTRNSTQLINSAQFSVKPESRFDLDIPVGAGKGAEEVGFAAIIFLDAQGREVGRRKVAFTSSELPIATLLTDPQGRFFITVPGEMLDRVESWRAIFAGDDHWRSSFATVPQSR